MDKIFKKSFLEGFASADITTSSIVAALLVTLVIAIYIFFVYRVLTRKTFYSKNFNISLVGVALITTAIICTMQSSIVVSLGMVGALSIVRFRTAVKDPMDLMFLFWSISIGIICGAGLALFAVVLSVVLTVAVVVLNYMPIAKAPMILIVNASDVSIEDNIAGVLKKHTSHFSVKSRNMTKNRLDITFECRTSEGSELLKQVLSLEGVESASLLNHDGEVTF